MKNLKKIFTNNRFSFLLILLFSLACFKVCAEEKAVSPGEAQIMRENFVNEIKTHIGAPYEYGGIGPDAFDCSGLIYYSAQKANKIQLPRTAKAIYNYVRIISDEKKELGDLMFFKTSDSSTISHIGVYIGNNQFISAISDGQNTGVIVSSLNQDYWKDKYISTGQFLPSAKNKETEKLDELVFSTDDFEQASFGSSAFSDSTEKSTADKIIFDTSLFFDWSLLSPRQFVFRYRGIDAEFHASYDGWSLKPGAGFFLRFNAGLDTFQMPLVLSLSMNDFIRVYAGPVFTFNDVKLIDTDKKIESSVFPGIIGVSFSTPQWKIGKVALQGVQDISYTVYNKPDGSALPFVESIAAGLVMYTGIKCSFPLSIFLK